MIPFILKKQLDSDRFNDYLYTANTTNQFSNYGYAVQLLEQRARDMLKIDDNKSIIATSSGSTALEHLQPIAKLDYEKEIHKRIYHNLPYLIKTKGTERGLRALINCFGITPEILSIKTL